VEHDAAALHSLTRRASCVSSQCSSDLSAGTQIFVDVPTLIGPAGQYFSKLVKHIYQILTCHYRYVPPDCTISRYIKVFVLEVTSTSWVQPVWMQASDIRGLLALLASQRSSVCLAFTNLLWTCMCVIWLCVYLMLSLLIKFVGITHVHRWQLCSKLCHLEDKDVN
jgi:hypothetical protein